MRSLVIALLIVVSMSFSQQPDKYSRIRIYVPDASVLASIWRTGLDYEGASGKPGGWMEFVAGPEELRNLSSAGIAYQVVIDDLSADYLQRQAGVTAPTGFGYGSMGGFYTYDEILVQLDSMALLYPSLISTRTPIGASVQGRGLWATEISAHPLDAQPEVLYTALHHAREPEGMMSVLYYMWWLLQNYGSDSEATYLVNNRHLWFLPVVNPDGYVYNQTTNPSGGGFWRKNRENNGDGTFGVDLNRNYGTFKMWNAPNGGSSSSTASETYRGTAPFSEPETQAIDSFVRSHSFKTCFNYHTYGNYLVYPWGYLSKESADSLIYRDWTYDMIAADHFTNGTDQQTVSYSTRGNSDDYLFGDTSKALTYAMTPEVGATGFWPSVPEILPLAIATLPQNKILAHVAGQYSTLVASSVIDSAGGGFLLRRTSFSLLLSVKNRGLDSATGLTLTVSATSPYVRFADSTLSIDSLQAQETKVVAVNGAIASGAIVGTPFQVYVTIRDPFGYRKDETLHLFLGAPATLFADSASAGTGNWTTGQGWGLTSNAHTPPSAFTDSPSGGYLANADNSLTMANRVSLSEYQYAELRFWTKWAVEPTWDFATVEISTDSGSTWTTLRTKLSHSGSDRDAIQAAAKWGYESYTPGLTWVEQQVDLTPYINDTVTLRFRMASDGGDQRDGFYVDDVRLYGYTIDTDTIPPLTAPVLIEPINGALYRPTALTVRWNGTSGASRYHLQVALDSLFASPVLDDTTITDTLHGMSALQDDTTYYWRLRAIDSRGQGPMSAVYRFTTGTDSVSIHMVEGWNLICLPIVVPDAHLSVLYPTMLSGGFLYQPNSGYEIRDSLLYATGYWLRFDSADTFVLAGHPQEMATIPVVEGWNLIGSVSGILPASTISSLPGGIQTGKFFEYAGGSYAVADTLRPGRGYWVKVTQAGALTLSAASPGSSNRIHIVASGELPPKPPAGGAGGSSGLPAAYALEQNFPNPFNPSTEIRYALPEPATVVLRIYNVLGEVVATLVEGNQNAGYHLAQWDASRFGSGVYFCRLQATSDGTKRATFSGIRKMLLIR